MKNKMRKIGSSIVVILFFVSTVSATITSQSINDMNDTARDRYNTVTAEYQKNSVFYTDAKQDWLAARERYKQSNDTQDLTVALEKANLFLLEVKRKLINHIERISAYIEGEQNIEDVEKQKILDELSSYTRWLEKLHQRIKNATTKTKFTEIAEIVRAKWQEIVQLTKRIIGQIINAKISELIEKAEIVANRIKKILRDFNEQGEDTEALESWLNDVIEKINLAKQKYQRAREKYVNVSNHRETDDLIREGKMFLLEAKRYLKNAYQTLRELIKELRRYRTREVTLSGTGTLIAEGDGRAYIAGNGTVELSGKNGTLIVTDNSGDITIRVAGFGGKTEIETNKWQYTGTGSATITGSGIIIELDGRNIHLIAEGTGSVKLTGSGTYTIYKRSSDRNSVCEAENWSADGTTIGLALTGG